jgi:hypothetical protein
MKDIYFIAVNLLKDEEKKVSLSEMRLGDKGLDKPVTVGGVKCDAFYCKQGTVMGIKPIKEPATATADVK